VGRIPGDLRAGLREMAMAVVQRDAAQLVAAFEALGMLLPGANLALLEQAQSRLFALFGGKNMSELHEVDRQQMRQFTDDFRELIYDLPFQIPNNLLLLGRTVAILSGMCSGLDPAFDLWRELEPFAQKLVAQEAIPAVGQILGEARKLAAALLAIPPKAERALDRIERDGLAVRTPELSRQLARLERGLNRLIAALLMAALLWAGSQFAIAGRATESRLLLGGAALALLAIVWPHRQ
jgi:predicted unusual protein kinase regulating ubiquinone biosynthesis (AarF/ABC1/UbiB family)